MDKRVSRILYFVLTFLLAALFIFPLVWMVASSMKPEKDVFEQLGTWRSFLPSSNLVEWFAPYKEISSRFNLLRYVGNSIFYATCVTIGSILVNSLAGYAFAKFEFRGKKFLFALMLALLVIPAETIMITKFSIVQRLGILNTRFAVILPALSAPLFIYMFRQFFRAVSDEILEAAKIEGASHFRIFWNIMLPLSKPAIATVGTLSFIGSWNDYIWPLMVLTNTNDFPLQVAITNINNTQPTYTNQIMAMLTISTIPLIIIYVFFQKYLVQGLGSTGTGVK
ncbi:ABC transporter permease [Streptococcus azizii]|uniref:ABC transporter permease n=1 Tax=Streptococcus azizii TaxID=1579424 RepID=A0AB36JS49_9STRE|nr:MULTISPECIES: carbohydrate ABC transporter permease [Streptococcus]MBF0776230.1 carbohydrate ABC transporter permease [Streptococcus sp. 19428wD3_AN2]ONK28088.1 ABC transporter permease [Streptococcus azizii]ONK30486.1 ABC transporter permease [Streptococcus azizii]ONK31035.1 ABC transporter permease [Streptococcus azizii]TFU83360.1 carbohydrate ABC transporter permease [Streptococcus sp. AN2]